MAWAFWAQMVSPRYTNPLMTVLNRWRDAQLHAPIQAARLNRLNDMRRFDILLAR